MWIRFLAVHREKYRLKLHGQQAVNDRPAELENCSSSRGLIGFSLYVSSTTDYVFDI